MSNDMLAQLRAVPLFAGLKDRALKDVLERTREVEHTGGEIVEEGQQGVGFHLILDGTATVLQGGQVRRTLGPGDYFGEISMIDGKPRSATVHAKTPVTTISLASWAFYPILDEHPDVSKELLKVMCARLRAAEA